MFHKAFRLLFVFILVFGSVAVQAPSPTRAAGPWYVAPTGDDGNDCLSPGAPCATINGAIGKASSGDTIHVAAGTYTGSGSEVVLVDRDLNLIGGWDPGFSAQNGTSIIDGGDVRKGILVNSSVTAVVERFMIRNGSAVEGSGISLHGGGIYNGGSLTLTDVVVTDNQAQNGGGISNGGGESNSVGNLTIENSWIYGNSSRDAGGGIYNYIGTLTIDNSTVSNNTTSDAGGGIINFCCSGPSGGSVVLNNSTVSSNVAGRGGGFSNAGSLSLNSSTITDNSFSGNFGFGSGGIDNGYGGTVSLKNSVLANNTAPFFLSSPDCSGPIDSLGYNIVGDPAGCTFVAGAGDLTDVDPKLGPLVGSPPYHPLHADSAAIDAGNPAGCTDNNGNPLATDQRGAVRNGTCDIGAYEFTNPGSAASLVAQGGNHQSTLTSSAFPLPLQVSALDGQGSPVGGVTVNFTAPESGPSGIFSDTGTNATSAVTNSDGIATAAVITANDQAGSYSVTASAAGVGTVDFTLEHLARPANDNFASAEVIDSLPFSAVVDNTFATAEVDEPNNCTFPQHSVWYTFIPDADVTAQVSMPVSQVGGGVSIFHASGPGITDLTLLSCSFTGTSTNIQLVGGETYYFRLDSFGQTGILQFNLEQISPPDNDNFAGAVDLGSLPISASVNNSNATAETGEPNDCSFPFRSVWYTFTPAEDVTVRVDTQGSHPSAAASIFHAAGTGLPGLVSLGCVYNHLTANVQLKGGETYYFRLDSSGEAGDLHINVEQILPPGNDNFIDAVEIGALPFSANVSNIDATAEAGEPQNCNFPYRSVWYSFSPPLDMAVRLTIDGTIGNGNVSLFLGTGPSITDLSFQTCAFTNSPTNTLLEGGETYYLQVDSSFGQPGDFQVGLEQIFPPGNDNFTDAQLIDPLPFNVTVDNTDATQEADEPLGCGFSARSLWYTLTPADDLPVRMSAVGSTTSASIALYAAGGPAITDLSLETCIGSSPRNLILNGGTTYFLQVDSFGQGGAIQVNVEPLNPPANDNFAAADPLGAVPFNTSVDISDATFELNEPLSCGSTPGTVWYSFNPAETMPLRANTFGSAIDGNVTVLRANGDTFADLEFLGCSANGGNVSFLAEAGQTYYFQVGAASGQAGMVQFNLTPVAAPANDHFANAVEVGSLPFSASVDATDASVETDEPQFCAFMPATVWYSFTPAETVKVRADTLGSPVDANANVYLSVGDGFADLQFLGCSGFAGATAFLAEAGQTYYFQVGGNGQGSPVQLNLAEVPVISGRLTDAVTGTPLPGDADPFGFVQLHRICGENCLEFVNSQQTDGEGRFFFDTYFHGVPLPAGEYEIQAFANLYKVGRFGPFSFSNENLDVGDLSLIPSAVIRGRLVDAVSGVPLAGASLTLNRCHNGDCFEFVNNQNSDENGAFRFNSYYFPEPIVAGTYELLISATGYEPKRVELTIADAEDRDLGDVPVDPVPSIGSISGRVVDSLSGVPLSPFFTPFVELQLCNPDFCSTVTSMAADSEGRFRFETDVSGVPLPAGEYRILAYADQYEFVFTERFEVGEGMHRTVGDVPLVSHPVRFTDIQPCDVIPASGGECEFSVRISNGMDRPLNGRTWSMADVNLPVSFIGFSQFQVKDPQDLDLGVGRSKVVRFRLKVPEHNSPFDGSICAQVVVGEGGNAYFNTLGQRFLFCVVRSGTGFEIVSPQEAMAEGAAHALAVASVGEVEPNNSCPMAQDMGVFSGPLTVDGSLDSEQAPDIDFYRFSGTPGAPVSIDHEGQSTGRGTLGDPLLGFFDSNCILITANDDTVGLNSHLEIVVPDDGVFIMAATAYPDFDFLGGGSGSYQMTVAPIEPIGSIRGLVVDAATGDPLPGSEEPFAFVRLLRCDQFGCSEVSFQNPGSDGSFHFETNFNGDPLLSGLYIVQVFADQYNTIQTEVFTVFGGEDHDAGILALQSFPLRFSNIQVCSVPSRGGQCDFSVTVTNGLATRFTGRAWTIINGQGLDSFLQYTLFQAETTRDISLAPGRSTTLRFRFRVPGSVPDGAFICATAYAGSSPDPLYNTVGIRGLFCFQKGSNGFTLLSQQQMQEHMQQLSVRETLPSEVPARPGK